jgi:uncharacterized LabA/DUF88 family protein
MGGFSSSPTPPVSFERAMVFIDGSNLFPDIRESKLKIPSFYKLGAMTVGSRQLTRVYVYTSKEKLEAAKQLHGEDCFSGCRVVLGDSIQLDDGKHREKGVDALLVADLVYHAAMKNFQYAVLISNDSDFAVALKRVEDFGCRTGLVSVIKKATQRLIEACDDFQFCTGEQLSERGVASKL